MVSKMQERNEEIMNKIRAAADAGVLDELAGKASADYVVFENVRKVYHVGEVDIEALADASFSVGKGELAVVEDVNGGKAT
jgi:hypothetical protein